MSVAHGLWCEQLCLGVHLCACVCVFICVCARSWLCGIDLEKGSRQLGAESKH